MESDLGLSHFDFLSVFVVDIHASFQDAPQDVT
jgi:hypothetical protein